MTCCPTCGQAINGPAPVKALADARLSNMERRIVDALARAFPRGIRSPELVELVYADDPNGGPVQTIALKIDAANLVPLRLGRIDQVSIGEWVVIVSDPFGLGYRVAVGVVSALARKQAPAPIAGYWGYLQTDARIHAGNSGGPVLNSIGEVIGLATATRDETAGVGLVLPVNRLRELVPALIRDGKITRSWIGMYIDKLSADQASKLKRKPDEGAQITGVVPGGPADRAGLRRGDVVLQFDGHAVNNTNALPQLAAVVSAGREVPVKVWRGGKELSFRLRTARMPE